MEGENSQGAFVLRPLSADDAPQARALILDGLAERWGTLDLSLVPDLEDLVASYRHGLFLVAKTGATIIGTGALIPEGPETGRIARMWVRPEHRRRGVGSAVLQALLSEAYARGYRRVVLETTPAWLDAVVFYQNRGFESLGIQDDQHRFCMTIG